MDTFIKFGAAFCVLVLVVSSAYFLFYFVKKLFNSSPTLPTYSSSPRVIQASPASFIPPYRPAPPQPLQPTLLGGVVVASPVNQQPAFDQVQTPTQTTLMSPNDIQALIAARNAAAAKQELPVVSDPEPVQPVIMGGQTVEMAAIQLPPDNIVPFPGASTVQMEAVKTVMGRPVTDEDVRQYGQGARVPSTTGSPTALAPQMKVG